MNVFPRARQWLTAESRFRRALVVLTLLAWLFRISFCVLMGFNRPPDGTTAWADQNFFENLAWQLSQGNGFITPEGHPTAFQAPGYPFLLAPLYAIFGRVYALNSLLQSTLGALAVFCCGLLARRLGLRPAVALLAALISAVLPTALVAAASFTSEASAQLFVTWMSLLLAWAMQSLGSRVGYRRLLLAGLVCGYGALVRPQMLAVPFFVGVCLVLSRQLPFWRGVWWSVSFGLAAAVVIAPWTLRNLVVMGGWSPITSSGGQTYLSANNPYTLNPADERFGYTELGGMVAEARERETLSEPDELKRDKLDYALGKRFKTDNPVSPVRLAMARAYRLLKFTTTAPSRLQRIGYFFDTLLLVPWFLFGLLIVLAYRPSRWRFTPIHIHVATLAVVTFAYFGMIRYRAAYDPILSILSAICLMWVVGVVQRGFRGGTEMLFEESASVPIPG